VKKKGNNKEGRRGGGGNDKARENSVGADDCPQICSSGFALSLYMSERETSESLCSQFDTLRTGDVDLRFYVTTVQDG